MKNKDDFKNEMKKGKYLNKYRFKKECVNFFSHKGT